MKIAKIIFVRRLLGRHRVAVTLNNGKTYKIKSSRGLVVCVPAPTTEEQGAILTVYKAVWLFLEGREGESLDRGAKIACGKIVELYDWPQDFTQNIQTRLEYIVNKIQNAENL